MITTPLLSPDTTHCFASHCSKTLQKLSIIFVSNPSRPHSLLKLLQSGFYFYHVVHSNGQFFDLGYQEYLTELITLFSLLSSLRCPGHHTHSSHSMSVVISYWIPLQVPFSFFFFSRASTGHAPFLYLYSFS